MHSYYNPYHQNQMTHHNPHHLKHTVITSIEPWVQYGLKEAQYTSYPYALRETAAITYLMGMGFEPTVAHQIVESWEINETFYP